MKQSSKKCLIKTEKKGNYIVYNLHLIIYRDGQVRYRVSRVFDSVLESAITVFELERAIEIFNYKMI